MALRRSVRPQYYSNTLDLTPGSTETRKVGPLCDAHSASDDARCSIRGRNESHSSGYHSNIHRAVIRRDAFICGRLDLHPQQLQLKGIAIVNEFLQQLTGRAPLDTGICRASLHAGERAHRPHRKTHHNISDTTRPLPRVDFRTPWP